MAGRLDTIASEMRTPVESLRARIEAVRQQLFAARENRVHPLKDDKTLTDWNGLMIAAFSKAAQVFDDPGYASAAGRAADFVLARLRRPDGRLLHRYRDGEAAVLGNVDDYAFLIWGLLELYEATFDVSRLETALSLNNDLEKHFWDPQSGGFFFTADDAEELIARKKETYDGAIPSGNAVAMLNLLRLGRITANTRLEERAAQIGRAVASDLAHQPSGHTQMLAAVDFAVGPSNEVVIVGDPQQSDTRVMLRALRSTFLPNKVVLLRLESEEASALTRIAEFTDAMRAVNGRATAHVCRNYTCQRPTNDAEEMMRALSAE
jgi:hypothetical protein